MPDPIKKEIKTLKDVVKNYYKDMVMTATIRNYAGRTVKENCTSPSRFFHHLAFRIKYSLNSTFHKQFDEWAERYLNRVKSVVDEQSARISTLAEDTLAPSQNLEETSAQEIKLNQDRSNLEAVQSKIELLKQEIEVENEGLNSIECLEENLLHREQSEKLLSGLKIPHLVKESLKDRLIEGDPVTIENCKMTLQIAIDLKKDLESRKLGSYRYSDEINRLTDMKTKIEKFLSFNQSLPQEYQLHSTENLKSLLSEKREKLRKLHTDLDEEKVREERFRKVLQESEEWFRERGLEIPCASRPISSPLGEVDQSDSHVTETDANVNFILDSSAESLLDDLKRAQVPDAICQMFKNLFTVLYADSTQLTYTKVKDSYSIQFSKPVKFHMQITEYLISSGVLLEIEKGLKFKVTKDGLDDIQGLKLSPNVPLVRGVDILSIKYYDNPISIKLGMRFGLYKGRLKFTNVWQFNHSVLTGSSHDFSESNTTLFKTKRKIKWGIGPASQKVHFGQTTEKLFQEMENWSIPPKVNFLFKTVLNTLVQRVGRDCLQEVTINKKGRCVLTFSEPQTLYFKIHEYDSPLKIILKIDKKLAFDLTKNGMESIKGIHGTMERVSIPDAKLYSITFENGTLQLRGGMLFQEATLQFNDYELLIQDLLHGNTSDMFPGYNPDSLEDLEEGLANAILADETFNAIPNWESLTEKEKQDKTLEVRREEHQKIELQLNELDAAISAKQTVIDELNSKMRRFVPDGNPLFFFHRDSWLKKVSQISIPADPLEEVRFEKVTIATVDKAIAWTKSEMDKLSGLEEQKKRLEELEKDFWVLENFRSCNDEMAEEYRMESTPKLQNMYKRLQNQYNAAVAGMDILSVQKRQADKRYQTLGVWLNAQH